MVFTSKMCEKLMWKSDILSKGASRWPTSLLKIFLCRMCFSYILLVRTKFLVSLCAEHWLETGNHAIFTQDLKLLFNSQKIALYIADGSRNIHFLLQFYYLWGRNFGGKEIWCMQRNINFGVNLIWQMAENIYYR